MNDSMVYLDTYVLQRDMRVRLPKSVLSNLDLEKGISMLDIFYDTEQKSIVLKKCDNRKETDWRITVKEAARIQTFPDGYVFCGNKGAAYTQIGNAVPCMLAEAVAKAVISYLDNHATTEEQQG